MKNTIIKPRRTALYMPCSNVRALEKAQTLAADVLLFDLEDAVSPDQKAHARTNIVTALSEYHYGHREKIVRINHVESGWGYDDLIALSGCEINGILLPKVESVEQVNQALAVLGREVPVWVMVETPKGVLNVEQVAAHKNVAVLVLGTNDLAKDTRARLVPGRVWPNQNRVKNFIMRSGAALWLPVRLIVMCLMEFITSLITKLVLLKFANRGIVWALMAKPLFIPNNWMVPIRYFLLLKVMLLMQKPW